MEIKGIGIKKIIGKRELFDNLNFHLKTGDFTVITGKSGAGKTTLLNIMGLLTKWDSGSLRFNDRVFTALNGKDVRTIRKQEAFIFQNFGLLEEESVYKNMLLPLLAYPRKQRQHSKDEITSALQRVNLTLSLNQPVFELSGGEKQRLAIARTLLQSASIILADEPTGELDDGNAQDIIKLLRQLANGGKMVVVATHDDRVIQGANQKIVIGPA